MNVIRADEGLSVAALLGRASVGQLREPAPEGLALDTILQAAMRAPDHGKLRPYRYVLIRGAARFAYADVAEAAIQRRDPEGAEPLVQRYRARVTSAPLIIALGAHIQPGHRIPEVEQMLTVGAAAMNMLNAIHMLGFGAVWVTGPNAYDPAIAAALGFHAPDRLAGFLLVGTPIEPPAAPRRPDPAEYVVEWTGG